MTPQPASTNTALPGSTPTACLVSFSDVPPTNVFYHYVQCLACHGILGGYSDGTFRPDSLITRGQLAKVVSNAAGLDQDPGSQMYEDIPASNPFYIWVNRLSNVGYMNGYPCGAEGEPCGQNNLPYFRPYGNATRGQIAKIVSTPWAQTTTPVISFSMMCRPAIPSICGCNVLLCTVSCSATSAVEPQGSLAAGARKPTSALTLTQLEAKQLRLCREVFLPRVRAVGASLLLSVRPLSSPTRSLDLLEKVILQDCYHIFRVAGRRLNLHVELSQ